MTGRQPTGVGIIGAGNISTQYLDNLTRFPDVEVRFIADAIPERAAAQAQKYGVPASGSVDALLAHEDVSVVANLTIPAAHAEIDQHCIAAGKHVYCEKPTAVTTEAALELYQVA